jgi:hypothetical protein
VIPVKFSLNLNGTATCQLPTATISLVRTAGGTIGAIDESTYLQSADNGSNFRISGCQYVYNLEASSLGSGAYRVDITINGAVAGSGVFRAEIKGQTPHPIIDWSTLRPPLTSGFDSPASHRSFSLARFRASSFYRGPTKGSGANSNRRSYRQPSLNRFNSQQDWRSFAVGIGDVASGE